MPDFSFGIITDTHVRAPSGDLSSPYAVNDKANDRARYACCLLAAQKPDFTIHLGDMVHPLPGMSAYDDACVESLEIFEPLKPKLFYVSGNHDVGDKPMPGSPAVPVDTSAMQKYSAHFGDHWYFHDHENIRVVVINSSLVNTGIDAEGKQLAWLKNTLINSEGKRVFLFSHYPLFLLDTEEAEHYDNIAQPGRSGLMQLLLNHDVEAVFSGHVHHFFYNRVNNTQFYILPSTCFTRQDYSDMFKISPAPEFGRDDMGKLAVTMVDIMATGHKVRIIGTDGVELTKEDLKRNTSDITQSERPQRKELQVSARHSLHSTTELPYNGPMEEFSRKHIRNDYPLLRLLQMGINNLRVPIQDFLSVARLQRLKDIQTLGINFHAIVIQTDWTSVLDNIDRFRTALSSVEYILPNDKGHWLAPSHNHLFDTPISIGYAATGAHSVNPNKPFAHSVSSGFDWSQSEEVFVWIEQHCKEVNMQSVVFQIPWEDDATQLLNSMNERFHTLNYGCLVNLRLAPSNPAESNFDDEAINSRVIEAISTASKLSHVSLQLDTFEDLDRGYSPRHGLIDRLHNCRAVGKALIAK